MADLTLYQFYCCPECTYKSQKDFLFRDHMKENHENVVSSKKMKLDASTLIHRFLQEDNNTEIHSTVSLNLQISAFLEAIMFASKAKINGFKKKIRTEWPRCRSEKNLFKNVDFSLLDTIHYAIT